MRLQGGKHVTVEELIRRATSRRKFDANTLFKPSLVYQVLKDPLWLWCEYHAPRAEAVDETRRYDRLRQQWGIEHEEAWVRQHYPDAVKIAPQFGFEALRSTLSAMVRGFRAIYQPQLWNLGGETYGRGDLLVRDDTWGSDLGPYHYRLVEVKRSKSLQEHHILDAAFYNRMLGRIQGRTPPEMTLALRETVEKASYAGREQALDEILLKWRTLRDGVRMPEPRRPPEVTASPWRVFGNKLVDSMKDLVLLTGVGDRERQKLREAGIHRIDHLWTLPLEEICKILGNHHGYQAFHVAQAYKTGQPILKPNARLTIPRAQRHLYFDFESVDDLHPTVPPHVYLIGCWDAEREQYVMFLARGPAHECRIFNEFVEYVGVGDRARLYHWTGYEIAQMRNVIHRWPHLEAPLDRLISTCVDLMQVVKYAVYLPAARLSLKCVAPALGFRWRQGHFDAFESMVCYWDYLEGADALIMDNALEYNEDDCRAMWHVDRELSNRFGQARPGGNNT